MKKEEILSLIGTIEDLYKLIDGLRDICLLLDQKGYSKLWGIEQVLIAHSKYACLSEREQDVQIDTFYEILENRDITIEEKYDLLFEE